MQRRWPWCAAAIGALIVGIWSPVISVLAMALLIVLAGISVAFDLLGAATVLSRPGGPTHRSVRFVRLIGVAFAAMMFIVVAVPPLLAWTR